MNLAAVLEQPLVQISLRALIVFLVAFVAQLPVLFGLIKISAHVHSRVGPMYPGRFHGIGWPIAEALKWIQKEDIIPSRADRPVFSLAPILAFVPAVMTFAVIPVAPGWVGADTENGLVYVLAFSALGAIAIVMAAYSARSKFTLIGGLRAVGQIIAYELPVLFGAVSIAMLAGSLSLTEIVEAQSVPFLIWPFPFGALAFMVFLVASFAEVMWAPFDMPVAESELVTGPFTEYSGMRFIFFMMAEFAHVLALSAVGTLLFLGGWRGPWLPPVVWFLLKMTAFVVFFIWIRFTLPRLREDQLMRFGWKVLVELATLNLIGIALYKVLV